MSNIYIQEPPALGKVLLKTSVGEIDVELWTKEAPKACRNFLQLCMEGYYNGTIFHRVVPGFIVQGGDPNGDGTGGESIYGEPFKDEFHSRLRFNRRGLVAMANAGKDDNGSQFFFTLGATPELQNKHTIFGKVTGETIYNMLKLAEGLIGPDERPEHPHKITSTTVLINPFTDIVPRVTAVKIEEPPKKKKKERIGVKLTCTNFFTELELEEESMKEEMSNKDLEKKKEETVVAVNNIRDKLSSKKRGKSPENESNKRRKEDDNDKESSAEEEYYLGKERDMERLKERDRIRNEIRQLKKEMKDTKEDNIKAEDLKEEKKPEKSIEDNEMYKQFVEEQEKYKKIKEKIPKKGAARSRRTKFTRKTTRKKPWVKNLYENRDYPDNYTDRKFLEELRKNLFVEKVTLKQAVQGSFRVVLRLCLCVMYAVLEDFTLQLLAKFKNKLHAIKEKNQTENETIKEDDENFNTPDWMGHTLRFEDKGAVLAKDASNKGDDWFDIYDPRNPLNKRKREKSDRKNCFERISIGEHLPRDAIYRNISELTTKECEQICKQDKQCQSYDYGVGAKGNATCNLSTISEKDIKDKSVLGRHPDYDVYVRRFQCEQSPPTPIQAEFDDPDGLLHRPTFKPASDPKKPLSDEVLDDLGSYSNSDTSKKPAYNNERPDDYDNLKPDYDSPPSYGLHKPQDVPYPTENPQINMSNTRPDPYDVLQFQDQYGRPRPQGTWRPEEMYGHRPDDFGPDPYRPEIPQYQYIIRPNRKPHQSSRPENDDGYGNKPDYNGKPDSYGQNIPSTSLDRPYKPNKPSNTYPSRPNDKPNYSYNSQYASNYGSQYHDNSIYLEIYDPPRTYKPPSKPNRPGYGINQGDYEYGHLGYGYDTFTSQNSYSHLQNSQSQYYGSGILNQDNSYRPDPEYSLKPTKPYDIQDVGYGSQSSSNQNSGGYGLLSTSKPKPNKKPSYGGYGTQGATDSYGSSGYGSGGSGYYSNSQSFVGSENYESNSQSHYSSSHIQNEKPQNSNHGYGGDSQSNQAPYGGSSQASNKKPYKGQGYGSNNQNYGADQASYGFNNNEYGGGQTTNRPYGSGQGYGSNSQSHYGSNQGSYGDKYGSHHEYGSSNHNKPGYSDGSSNDKPYSSSLGYGSSSHSNQGAYGETSHSSNIPYGGSQGYDSSSSSYGSSKPQGSNSVYGNNNKKPSGVSTSYGDGYESSSGYNSNHASYGGTQYEISQGYGGQNTYDGNSNSYGGTHHSNKPYGGSTSSRPYGPNEGYNDRPVYGSNTEGNGNYGGQTHSSGYNARPSHKPDRPSSSHSYTSQHNSQYQSQNSFESSSSYNRPIDDGGYRKPGNQSSYGNGYDRDRLNVKPVYEYEIDRPGEASGYGKPNGDVITTRPVAVGDYTGKPNYGRDPGGEISYKDRWMDEWMDVCLKVSPIASTILSAVKNTDSACVSLPTYSHVESMAWSTLPMLREHWLDPAFRGKGLCELMTKPIEAFDLRRDFVEDKDYDFYELDRNSLEPNCPDTLRGPGLLHSGFLSNKRPGHDVDRWKDRIDWYDRSSQSEYERHYNERRRVVNSNRRYQNEVFVPYQIGVSRSDEDSETGRQYGGAYGGHNYYKDKTDYRKSFNHWQISDEAHRSNYYGVKSHSLNSDFNYNSLRKDSGWENSGYGYGAWKRGRWNNSWNGYDYGESDHYKYNKPPVYYELDRMDGLPAKDCSSRRRPGMSLGTGAIRRSLFARNVVECEAACFGEKEFKCVSYSYRYSNGRGSDNCFLSERPYRGLDMSADSDSDVYAMPQDQGCATVSRTPWVESECFWHVRSESAVAGSAARASLTVTGLGACEAECIRAHAFFCRGFSFRFDSPKIGDDLENCILTSSPPTSLEIGHGLRTTAGHELYARGNYGRGCEPALYDDVQHKDTECFLKYDNAAKLKGTAVRGLARVKDEQECGRACTDAPFTCLSFSFTKKAPQGRDNCLLSEIRLFDLQRGVDYEPSTDDWLFAFDLFNERCWRKVHGKQEYDTPSFELPHPIAPSEYPPSGPTGHDHSGPSGPSYPSASGPSGPDFKPGYPTGPEPPINKPGHSAPSGPGHKPSYSPGYVPDTAPSGPSGPDYKPYIPSSPGYIEPYAPTFKPAYPPPTYKPVIPLPPRKPLPIPPSGSDYRPAYPPSPPSGPGYKPIYRPIEPNRPPLPPKPEHRPGSSRPGYEGDREENGGLLMSWRQYTVSGFPCRRGTTCAQNHIAGHWACEPEGGEIGSWDYCCAPTHRCGYSEGFKKPWCYVGPTHEQWRPCSEKYYPYFKHKVPHPSQGQREPSPSQVSGQWRDRSGNIPQSEERPGPYLADADRSYWDNLYKNGPRAYYDKHGNPLPGYTRVPTEERPRIKYHHNQPQPGNGTWVPVPDLGGFDNRVVPEPLGAPRYWPVAYLHKGPPPNMTYFRYNETDHTSYDRSQSRESEDGIALPTERSINEFKRVDVIRPKGTDIEGRKIKDEPTDNKTDVDENILEFENDTTTTTSTTTTSTTTTTTTTTTTPKSNSYKSNNDSEVINNLTDTNTTEIQISKPDNVDTNEEFDNIKGIDGKLGDFSKSIEVFELEDRSKCDKETDFKTLEAEERQIEAIGRLVASRRGGKLILEKRSQKDLESKNIAVDKDLLEFNFGNKFPTTERRGIIQRVSKDEIDKERFTNDKSLEVSETTFVRPPRILSTTENIRKAIVNGKVFYDATIREQRDLITNATRKAKSLKLDEARGPSVISTNLNTKRKTIQPRNVNPIRKVRRVFRKRYNPEEVRKRLLEREKYLKSSDNKPKVEEK
ncbi:Peptidyl-prolyl isomerase cwc27 [Papilio machaon]|uniref:Spliceosome-associated protein CWC27 homolog n=1 Tax=Papilio machaon TaxID=76193 RepID=A0A194R138_PAPMA|nr:Peptidyl-prolyl isomerase cwc27 [Papilio machaon]